MLQGPLLSERLDKRCGRSSNSEVTAREVNGAESKEWGMLGTKKPSWNI